METQEKSVYDPRRHKLKPSEKGQLVGGEQVRSSGVRNSGESVGGNGRHGNPIPTLSE